MQQKQWEVNVEIMKYAKRSSWHWAFLRIEHHVHSLSLPLCPYNFL